MRDHETETDVACAAPATLGVCPNIREFVLGEKTRKGDNVRTGKSYRAYRPEQTLLLPPDRREWVPAEHLVWFVSDLVDALDLTAIEAYYEAETRGQPPYHPRLLVKLLVYGYCRTCDPLLRRQEYGSESRL